MGKSKAALRFRRLQHVDKITVFVDSDFAGDPVSREAQIGNRTVKSGSALQSLTAMSIGEAEFYAVVNGGQVGRSLRSMYQDLGIPNKVTIRRQIHAVLLDTRTSPRWRPQYQEGAYSEELRRCWNEASLCFSTTTTLQTCRIGILLTMYPTLHYKMKAEEANDGFNDGAADPI